MPVSELFRELRQQYAAALFADKKHLVEPIAEWVAKVKHEYLVTEHRAKELRDSYLKALGGISLSDQVEAVRKELRTTDARLRHIRSGIEERLAKLFNSPTAHGSI